MLTHNKLPSGHKCSYMTSDIKMTLLYVYCVTCPLCGGISWGRWWSRKSQLVWTPQNVLEKVVLPSPSPFHLFPKWQGGLCMVHNVNRSILSTEHNNTKNFLPHRQSPTGNLCDEFILLSAKRKLSCWEILPKSNKVLWTCCPMGSLGMKTLLSPWSFSFPSMPIC